MFSAELDKCDYSDTQGHKGRSFKKNLFCQTGNKKYGIYTK